MGGKACLAQTNKGVSDRYTGKDQIRPLNAVKKQRNCHIKFAMFDDQVAIFGNGNQDTQSWMHSQETNVMIDNKEIVAELMHSKPLASDFISS
jgi:phosphatidylserine/phosphatidylglycerophosphate/cardiolipin synthase-like enzyme